jgi:phage shock protein PspC (stress-responsive transcriptional regulator)
MAAKNTPLAFRHDTLLGVCEGLGRDLGIHPNYFRIAFSMLLLWNPIIVVSVYLALGVVRGLVYWLVPDLRSEAPAGEAEFEDAQSDLRLAA